jgi:GLPGLI family protein
MQKILMTCFALAYMLSASAQKGTVVYNETMKLELHLEGDVAGIQDMLPKEQKISMLLHFTEDASLYQNIKQGDDQEVSEEMAGGGNMVIKMEQPDEKLYVDFKKQKVVDQRDFMSRIFLIESMTDTLPWKLTGNRREILGYPCLEASYTKDSSSALAWFTPSIPVPAGPGSYRGLPGLILEVNVNDGKRVISAASVTMADVTDQVVKPKKGKKISKDEFNKMVEEKTGQSNNGGGAVFMIKIDR